MYHGPWSVFILAKYYGGAQGPSTAMLQFMLQLLYIGCGLGKMGPWFVSVFNQEWTLPPWGKFLDLRPYLYKGDFPKDNTPSATGVALAYAAASSEWIAPLLMLCTSGVVGGEPGAMTPCVFAGIFIIIAMHFYINFHIAAFDVWMLNFTPAYLVYNVYYLSPHISEPGFDYAGFSELHPAVYWFCWFMVAYVAYGQIFPEKMTYMHCFRFWAGNWPQAWVLVSKKGYEKLLASFPNQAKHGPPEGVFTALQGPLWAFNFLGMFQTAQLSHRYLPVAMHKALAYGAKERGDEMPSSLSDFQDNQGGFIGFGSLFFGWGAGYHVNDALRAKYFLGEFQERCKWEAGDCLLIEGSSFPVFASVTGAKSHWSITDAKMGLVEDGWVNTTEAVGITRPSMLRNYSGDKKST